MIIDYLSEWNGECPELKGGDLLIISGMVLYGFDDVLDLQNFEKEVIRFAKKIYKRIVYISNNTDFLMLDEYGWSWSHCECLIDEKPGTEPVRIVYDS